MLSASICKNTVGIHFASSSYIFLVPIQNEKKGNGVINLHSLLQKRESFFSLCHDYFRFWWTVN